MAGREARLYIGVRCESLCSARCQKIIVVGNDQPWIMKRTIHAFEMGVFFKRSQ